ncbi:MAG: TrmH family RNA methyltransferase [Candidatus Kapabacteria bacterium]|nr:TrmH family RNA methyltransferase [Candidatus Kapabacteria bacterium]
MKLTFEELTAKRLTASEVSTIPRLPVVAILENIRSAYNVGSIFRSADAFRIGGLVLAGYTAVPPRADIAKTALGADATVPWMTFASTVEAIHHWRNLGYRILALEIAHGAIAVTDMASIQTPYAIILGNELTGVSSEALANVDGCIEIPMYGVKHSLNVAVAAGIVFHVASSALPVVDSQA